MAGIGRAYEDPARFYFSSVYGRGVYQNTGTQTADPFTSDGTVVVGMAGEPHTSQVVRNIFSNESFFLRKSPLDNPGWNGFLVNNPPATAPILWPSDVVTLSDEQAAECTLFVDHDYTDKKVSVNTRKDTTGLLFSYGAAENLTNAAQIFPFSRRTEFSYQEERIRRFAIELCRTLARLNADGYLYGDFHFSRMFQLPDGQVWLDFSNLIFPVTLKEQSVRIIFRGKLPESNDYPREFSDPAIINGYVNMMDERAQNVALASVLFFLFFGVLPYDGKMLLNYYDADPAADPARYYAKFRDYYKICVFILDEHDSSNAIPVTDSVEKERVDNLWENAPRVLRNLFQHVLRREGVLRNVTQHVPAPAEWLEIFHELGWDTPGTETADIPRQEMQQRQQ